MFLSRTWPLPVEDPLHAKRLSSQTIKTPGDMRGVMASSNNPHPRGSLFGDEDVGPEDVHPEEDVESRRQGTLIAYETAQSPPQRVVSQAAVCIIDRF